jgi:hypothetical protein
LFRLFWTYENQGKCLIDSGHDLLLINQVSNQGITAAENSGRTMNNQATLQINQVANQGITTADNKVVTLNNQDSLPFFQG